MNLIRSYSYLAFYTATALVSLSSLYTSSADAAISCRRSLRTEEVPGELITQQYFDRNTTNPKPDYFNVKSYLADKSKKDIFGIVDTEFSAKYDTRFYYTATSPRKNKEIPFEIDPKSKAVYIFFHGSGTAQSSGKNFYGIMNNLAKLGFSALSFDYPFHGDGSLSPKLNNVSFFMKWVDSIVQDAKKSGKPVYLVGHSYGPDIIAEYVTRFPFAVDGALLMSPAGFDPVLASWYQNYTTKMKFGGEVPQNDAGGIWAGQMSEQYIWNKSQVADPTVLNPNLKIHVLSGDREEYVPAPIGGSKKTPIGPNTYDIGAAIKVFLKNSETMIEKGIGHYLFNHTDENGNNVVMKEILRLAGYKIENSKKLAQEIALVGSQMSYPDRLLIRYSLDGKFKTFIDHYVGEKAFVQKMKNANDFVAKNISDQYDIYSRAYELKIAEYAASNAPAVRDFQIKNRSTVEAAKNNMKERFSEVLVLFSAYLESKNSAEAAKVLSDFHYTHPGRLDNLEK